MSLKIRGAEAPHREGADDPHPTASRSTSPSRGGKARVGLACYSAAARTSISSAIGLHSTPTP
ncbi:MAG TPA: hypothetical protein VN917_03755, partial [Xanthobacteraceae bacterium]|nr:hypothetical protein [Xanthobacteraceae bacterium]